MNDLFAPASSDGPRIRVGIGGWNYAPWRDNFYPAKLVQRRELEYASRQLRAIEINGTFYGAQKPATYAKWAAETPAGFIFSLKAPRYITEGKRLADTGKGVSGFVHGGLAEMGDRLGPILWQLPPSRPFDASDLAALRRQALALLGDEALLLRALAPSLSEAKYPDYEPEGEDCTREDLEAALADGLDLLRDPASRWFWLPESQTLWRNGEVVDVPADVRPWLPRLLQGRRQLAARLREAPAAVLDWLADEISAGYWLPMDAGDNGDA